MRDMQRRVGALENKVFRRERIGGPWAAALLTYSV